MHDIFKRLKKKKHFFNKDEHIINHFRLIKFSSSAI